MRTNSSCVAGAIAAADSWLCSHPLGSNVTANSQTWKQITSSYSMLANNNEDLLWTPARKYFAMPGAANPLSKQGDN